MTRFSREVGVALVACFATACGGADPDAGDPMSGPLQAVEEWVGDTLVVHTIRGSERGTGRLAEELRIGTVEGAAHEMFGRISALAVTPGGEVLVHDAQAASIRRFDAQGTWLGSIGRAGSGPGEFRNVAGIGVVPDGRIVVNDFGNRRFNVYGPDGAFSDTWLVQPAIAAMRPVHVTEQGEVLLHDARTRRLNDRNFREEVLVRLDRDGRPADTIVIPHAEFRAPALEVRSENMSFGVLLPFAPGKSWTVTPEGAVAVTIGDRYAVDVHRPDGTVTRFTRAADPVPVSPEERAAEEERVTDLFREGVPGWRWDGPPIPAVRPPVSWVHAGTDGTLWVRVAQPGTVIPEDARSAADLTFVTAPLVFDVFQNDGRYTGQVSAPTGFLLQPHPVFGRDHVWAVVQDEQGVQFVARYRIEWDSR